MKTSYDYLQELCALPPDFNARRPQADPRNRRVRYLLQALNTMGVEHQIDCFAASGYGDAQADAPRFANIVACVRASAPGATASVMLLAHHDVANPDLENCNDNTASCAHLLALLGQLQAAPLPDRTVWVTFVDAEEICSFRRSGAARLARQLRTGVYGHVSWCLNLELTAHGTHLYTDRHLPSVAAAAGVPLAEVATPFNDATVLRHWGIAASAVVGTLPEQELATLREGKTTSCPTWARCHRVSDRLSHARAEDMVQFGQTLYRIARFSALSGMGVAVASSEAGSALHHTL
ncbi:M28 family peptidase [Hymenobacter jejuensis]|uniref:M28 family peptidase n=1 Tax=Hymenobacter jejuensis TaxID=2502781 RepID=A0A5B7ZWM9_9BACT|nr:M28 family peptidase [Hymenobacter jejuensis]QDA59015.1 M28 family peptidase [Hymenobacter jejuensis]